ncbi:copper homeostasis protein CutC [Elizabethkingia meningoseptica]|uniref:copper homeostasis protein CutC n=1 Tax=Elizabethkingia meningoseptica TaxID=238 RepID=UPI0030171214
MTKIEVACFNEQSALIAAKEGADRIELCENYAEGGLTPEKETLKKLKAGFSTPVFTMIRPRGGGFQYTDAEFETMKTELTALKEAGADGFVFGFLTPDNEVDMVKNKALVELAGGLPCTFHRAFDRIKDKEEALEDVINCGFATILTSGGEHPAMEGLSKLKLIQEQADGRITILVGGGVRSSNVGELKKYFGFVHSACITDGTENIDAEELKAIKTVINN